MVRMFAAIGLMVASTVPPALAAENPLCVENRHSQALLIGNKDYRETFAVPYAHNDVAAMEKFLVERLCYRKGNIKVLKNATFNDMRAWLGTDRSPRGLLWNRARKGRSNIFVYYSGHGVPDAATGKAYLLTVDTRPDQPGLGYSRNLLTHNLERLNKFIGPRRTVTMVLDACFSGRSAGGALQAHSGAINPESLLETDVLRFTASSAAQLAFWNKEKKLGLFTSVFLDAVEGGADTAENGNRDGRVSGRELVVYLAEEVAYRARGLNGSEQTPSLPDGDSLGWEFDVSTPGPAAGERSVLDRSARLWADFKETKNIAVLEVVREKITDPAYRALVDERIALLRAAPPEKERCGDLVVTVGTGEKCLEPGDVFTDCKGCPSMVVVPAGSFMMGSPKNELKRYGVEGPRHRVIISKAFAVGRFEIAQGQYDEFVQTTGHKTGGKCWTFENGDFKERSDRSYLSPGFKQDGAHPVVCVNWNDAKAYIGWLRKKTGKNYRLLSEAEWEYVARAGTDTPFWFGSRPTTDLANYDGTYTYNGPKGQYRKKTVPVDSFKSNAFGLFNVHGNVWEWVEDCWIDNYKNGPNTSAPRTSGDCRVRVRRGGGWLGGPRNLRSAIRGRSDTDDGGYNVGFRVARTLTP